MLYKQVLTGNLMRLLPMALLCLTMLAPTFVSGSPSPPDEVKKLIKQATKLSRAGLNEEAEVILRKAVDLDPNRSIAKVELAYVLTKQRKLRDAYDICYPIAKAEPKNSRAFAVLGATLLTAGRFGEARAVLYTAITLNNSEHLAWAGYGMLDFYENRINESLENLKEAVFNEPDEPDYVFTLAQVSARAERYKEAATAYRRFLDISKSTDTDRRDRIKGLISFLEYLGNSGGLYLNSGRDQTVVPFEMIGNRPVIRVRVNRKNEELRFVLDTGSGITVLSDETAKRMRINPVARGGYARGLGGDGKFEIVYGQLKEMSIGDVSVRSVPVYIRKFHQAGAEVDGYIGLALISKFLTTIDYGSQTFALTRRETDRREFAARSGVSVPLRLTSSGFLSGEVELQGIDAKLNFIVDTGASVSVISDRVSRLEGVRGFADDEKLRVIGSAGITDDVPTFLLPKVTFGQHSAESVKAVALNLDIINEASGFEQAGILGGNFLKNYRLTFDFKNSKVTFVSVKPDKD